MRSTRFYLAVLACALFFAVPAAFAADPVLTIVFSGNTYGNFEPCPT